MNPVVGVIFCHKTICRIGKNVLLRLFNNFVIVCSGPTKIRMCLSFMVIRQKWDSFVQCGLLSNNSPGLIV